jgi:hypothetical protein
MAEIGNQLHVVMESITHEWERVFTETMDKMQKGLHTKRYTHPKGESTPKRKVAEGRPVLTKPPAFVLDELLTKKPTRRSGKVSKRRAKNRVASQSRKVNRHKH